MPSVLTVWYIIAFNDSYTWVIKSKDCYNYRNVRMFQLTEKFDEMHKKRPSVRRFDESDILTVTEAVCNGPFDE